MDGIETNRDPPNEVPVRRTWEDQAVSGATDGDADGCISSAQDFLIPRNTTGTLCVPNVGSPALSLTHSKKRHSRCRAPTHQNPFRRPSRNRHPLTHKQRKIAQINCNGLMARMTELKNWIHRHKPLAILLQKTLLKEGQSVTPPSGYCESGRKDGKPYPPVNPQQRKTYVKPRGGVLTWIRLDTSYTHLPIQSAKEWVDICAIILRDREETALVNIYWTPNNSRANPEDASFLRDLPIRRNTVIAGDFNDHSSWDSCQSENQRGREVEDWILGSNLHCVNDCDTHTRTNPATGGHSSPDFTICSGDIAEDIGTSWKTGEDVGSDHLPIIWDLPHKRAR